MIQDVLQMHCDVELNKQGLNSKTFQRKLRVANKSETKLNFQNEKFTSRKQNKQRIFYKIRPVCMHACMCVAPAVMV